ncbi:hypothetical protein MBLNU457_5920t1 [Dothideomycetes sp. NU457]
MRSGFIGSLVATFVTCTVAQQISVFASDASLAAPGLANLVQLTWNNETVLVYPFMGYALRTLHAGSVQGVAVDATPSNQLGLNNNDIAFVSCDLYAYDGNIGPADVATQAQNNNVNAIILYSTNSMSCAASGENPQYSQLYTMESPSDAQTFLNSYNAAGSSPLTVTLSLTAAASQSPNNGPPQNQQNQNLNPNPRTATAMIILYSITGAITTMFIIIIIIGAFRAHRHPERFGPRNVLGMPRRSRARGIAQAMLDTIPVVKFGEREPAAQKDIELASTDQAETKDGAITKITADHDRKTVDAKTMDADAVSVRSGIAAESPRTSQNAEQADDMPGCSICTDDFEAGQDMRVLPCDHKFHPACIDPWLLNVSGTCPLCRIDLHPDSSDTNNSELPPPIDVDGTTPQSNFRRRDFFFMGLAGRTPRQMTQEERLDALRQWRAQHPEAQTTGGTDGQERRRRNRLSSLFGIRTRRRGETVGQENPAGERVGQAAAPATQAADPPASVGANTSAGSDAPRT